jgi:hypothetical protein
MPEYLLAVCANFDTEMVAVPAGLIASSAQGNYLFTRFWKHEEEAYAK